LLNRRSDQGVDTTAVALTYISYELAKHPELFDTLAKELSKYTDVASLKISELEQLPILNAVIRESLRIWSPVATFARVVPPQGTTLGGYQIPGGVPQPAF
jgi:cytochrome P450